MPDLSSAAREHAILSEIAEPLATLPDDPLPIAADVEFPIALRGYDRLAVDAYVRKTSQLVAELQATHSPEAAVRRALERVGEEISGILQSAHETANQITAQSRREAEDRLEVARREAFQITTEARARVIDLDAETDRIWEERQRIVEDSRELARQLMTLADAALERFPPSEPDPVAEPGTFTGPQPVAAPEADPMIDELLSVESLNGDEEQPTIVIGDVEQDAHQPEHLGADTVAWHPEDVEPDGHRD